MTSSGKNGLNIRTNASPKMGQDQVSGGVSVLRSKSTLQREKETDLTQCYDKSPYTFVIDYKICY